MSRLTWDGTAEPVSRDQILRCERGQGNIHFPCSADHEQDWHDNSLVICDDYTKYIDTINYKRSELLINLRWKKKSIIYLTAVRTVLPIYSGAIDPSGER